MSCVVTRNPQGLITKVTTPSGENSQLFEAIHAIPFMADSDTSLNIFSNAYTKEVQERVESGDIKAYGNNEPKLFIQSSDGTQYEDIEDAIIDNKSGNFSIGFTTQTEFIPIATFNTSSSERSQAIFNGIKEGNLSPRRVTDINGNTFFEGKGEYPETKRVTAQLFKMQAMVDAGEYVDVTDYGRISFRKKYEIPMAEMPDGSFVPVAREDIRNFIMQNPGIKNIPILLAQYSTYSRENENTRTEVQTVPKSRLEKSLTSFINSLGFSTTTLSEYKKAFNNRYGTDPDVEALVDTTNRVVAFADGKMTEANMSEEVAHLAIESFKDKESIEGGLSVVHLTPEYAQYSELYRAKYKDQATDELDLETLVRKEILGKVLARHLQNRFSEENIKVEEQTLLEWLRELWNRVMARISGKLRNYHIQTLQSLNEKIADAIIENRDDFDNELVSGNIFLSASQSVNSELEVELKKLKFYYEDLFRNKVREPNPNQAALERITEGMNEANTLSSIERMTSIAHTQLLKIEAEIKSALEKNDVIPVIEETRFIMINDNIKPSLESLRDGLLRTKDELDNSKKNLAESLISSIDEITSRISRISPQINNNRINRVNEEFERNTDGLDLSERDKELTRAQFEGVGRDLTALGRLTQLASKASNFVVKMIHRKAVEISTKTTLEFNNEGLSALDNIYDNGYEKYQKDIIETKDGKKTGWLISPFSYAERENDKKVFILDKIVELTGRDKKEVEKDLKSKKPTELLTQEQYEIFTTAFEDYDLNNLSNRQRSTKYYEDRRTRFDNLKTSQYTREHLSNRNRATYTITNKAQNSDGTIDKSKLSESEKLTLASYKKSRAIDKSAFDQFGQPKEGIVRVKSSELTQAQKQYFLDEHSLVIDEDYAGDVTTLAPGYTLDSLNDESRLAFDLSNLDLKYRQEFKNQEIGTPKDSFIQKLRELEENGEDTLSWFFENGTIAFKDSYFENIDNNAGYDSQVKEYIDSITDTEIKGSKQRLLDSYTNLQRVRKDLIRQNKMPGNPIEVDVKNMDDKIRREIVDLDQLIEHTRQEIDLPQEFRKEMGLSSSTTELNEDFNKMRRESGLTEYEFALTHMTETRRGQVLRFNQQVKEYILGTRTRISRSFETFINNAVENGSVTEGMLENNPLKAHEILSGLYAKQFVASYFKRFTPDGYNELLQSIRNGEVNLSDIVDPAVEVSGYEGLNNIEFTPDFSWNNEIATPEYINEEYFEDGEYYVKPKFKYLNNEFFTKFGIDKNEWIKNPTTDLNALTPTQNREAYELLKILTGLNKQAIDDYGDSTSASKFKMIPVSKDGIDKILGFLNPNARKEAITDFYQNKKDEKAFGEMLDENEGLGADISVRVVPRYFRADLEEGPDALSENIIHASLINLKQSILYKNRLAAESDMKAYLLKIQSQRFKANGGRELKQNISKSGEVSNWYKLADEYVNHHLYGVKQTRNFEVDVFGRPVNITKIATSIQAYSSFTNLAFNPLISLTSLATGGVNSIVNRIVADKYSRSSGKFATNEVSRLMGEHLMESGAVSKKNKLTKIQELLGITSIEERTSNSAYSRGWRLASKASYGLDELANKPITGISSIVVLKDTRYYTDGNSAGFYSYHAFVNRIGSKKEADVIWKAIENDSLYENIDFSTEGGTPNERFKEKYGPATEEAFLRLIAQASIRAKNLVQDVDGVLSQEDRVAAQRDVVTNSFMQHRGWMLINLQRGFKKRGLDVGSGRVEEGHYRTLLNMLTSVAKSIGNPQAVAEFYKELEEDQRLNLKRVGVETAIVLPILMLIGLAMLEGDDDDDTYIEDLAQLVYLRTVSEYNSSTVFGVPGSIIDAAERPVPALELLKSFEPTSLIRVIGEEDSQGNSKFWNQLLGKTNIVTRRAKTFSDLQTQIDAFRFYNTETLWWLGAAKKSN